MINPHLLWFGLLDSGFFSWFFLKVPSYFAYIYSNLKRTPKMARSHHEVKILHEQSCLKTFLSAFFSQESALNIPFSGYNHLIISPKCHNFQSVNPPFRASHFRVQPVSGASGDGGWEDCELTESGHFVRRCFWGIPHEDHLPISSHGFHKWMKLGDDPPLAGRWSQYFMKIPHFWTPPYWYWGNPARSTLLKEPMLDPLPEPCPRLVGVSANGVTTVDPPIHGRSIRGQHD
jgi:hypothetical protein